MNLHRVGWKASKVPTESDPCNPTLCALGAMPHAHCVCGLPMPLAATLCDLCRAEGLVPTKPRADDFAEEWDGRRHPSRRLNRPLNVPTDRYHALLAAVFGPTNEPAEIEEAA